jgi:hypothetical protein
MKLKLATGLVALLALTSCSLFRDTSGGGTLLADCQGRGTRANTCHPGPGGMTICRVTVREQGGGAAPIVEPYELVTNAPNPAATAPTTIIVWQIVGGGKFRDANDGPIIQSPGNQFSGRGPADMNGNPVPTESPHARILFLNSRVNTYKYSIKYFDRNGREYQCDPRINNSAS